MMRPCEPRAFMPFSSPHPLAGDLLPPVVVFLGTVVNLDEDEVTGQTMSGVLGDLFEVRLDVVLAACRLREDAVPFDGLELQLHGLRWSST